MKTMLTPFNASNEVQFKETPKMAKHGTGTTPADNALITASWARTMTKVIISRNNKKPPFWHVINFLGEGRQESKGIIDLLAIRKDHRKDGSLPQGDGFEIILVQVKGGKAPNPSSDDIERMKAVKKHYHAKSVVLSSWKKGSAPEFRVLSESGWGEPVDPDLIFGKPKVKANVGAKDQLTVSTKASGATKAANNRSAAAKAALETRRKAVSK